MKRQTIFSSFRNAINGLLYFATNERNGKIQLTAAAVAICFSLCCHVSVAEWIAVILCIGAVLCLEMVNSALEKLCDLVQPDYHPMVKIIKDVSAGAVLFASFVSVIIACIIFLPKIFVL